MMSIAIIDYGMANLRSVQKAFAEVGESAEIVSTPEQIEKADHVVLPGVGAFCDAIATLRSKNLADPIINHIRKDKPMLGICLGLQMLFDVGYEDGQHAGLGVVAGKCVRFDVDDTLGLQSSAHGLEPVDPAKRFTAAARFARRGRRLFRAWLSRGAGRSGGHCHHHRLRPAVCQQHPARESDGHAVSPGKEPEGGTADPGEFRAGLDEKKIEPPINADEHR